jgi:hypothetical protein
MTKTWNRARWLSKQGLSQEDYHQQKRLDNGQDPDEHTIWNILCPAIREGWSKAMERDRRVYGRRLAVRIQDSCGRLI